ncbi:MAG: peptidoglycan recognition protein family protein [Nocardioides sp.]|uniref:peptidoglycan recognition protein family protein n=1 Tax=Nocardioides sp. TaxID=35761 RepID=UPI003D6BF11A
MARFPRVITVTLTAVVLGASMLVPAIGSSIDPAVAGSSFLTRSAAADDDGQVIKLPRLEDGIATRDVKLASRLTERSAGAASTEKLGTTTFSMVGVSWTGEETPQVEVRVRKSDEWRKWQVMPLQEDLPDGAESLVAARGKAKRRGTQPVWTGRASGVQVRVKGAQPKDLLLTLINTGPQEDVKEPEEQAADDDLGYGASGRTARKKPRWAPQPAIFSRKQWGANNSWRNGRPEFNSSLKQVHIHHTATSNNYARGDVPGIIRGIYSYHTRSLGWFDIAYNFLIDKYGRAWEGRSGGVNRLVKGAHTLGFNHQSMGIALIGSFENVRPSDDALIKTERMAAWKLDMAGRDERGKLVTISKGSDRFPPGRRVRVWVIDGHFHTNETSCPGAQLAKWLPWIRKYAYKRDQMFNG